jgi:hypothetical protein
MPQIWYATTYAMQGSTPALPGADALGDDCGPFFSGDGVVFCDVDFFFGDGDGEDLRGVKPRPGGKDGSRDLRGERALRMAARGLRPV